MSVPETSPIDTIMLIDDEEVDQMLYRRIVERSEHAGRIVSFLDAEKALVHLVERKEPRPNLILLDINMPKMTGFEFLERLGASKLSDAAPMIFMLTTSFDPRDKARALEIDLVHGFLEKPLTDNKLAELRDAMSGKGAGQW